jgi:hypothetical protein
MTHDIFERLAAAGLPMTEIARNRRYVIVEKPAASATSLRRLRDSGATTPATTSGTDGAAALR